MGRDLLNSNTDSNTSSQTYGVKSDGRNYPMRDSLSSRSDSMTIDNYSQFNMQDVFSDSMQDAAQIQMQPLFINNTANAFSDSMHGTLRTTSGAISTNKIHTVCPGSLVVEQPDVISF